MRKAKNGDRFGRVTNKTAPHPARRTRGESAGAKPRTSRRGPAKAGGRKRSGDDRADRTKRARPAAGRHSSEHAAAPRAKAASARKPADKPRSPLRGHPADTTKRSATSAARSAAVASPEEMLQRAMAARTSRARALWARRGLATARRLDSTTQSMLLRQLYLAYYEERRFAKALAVSEQNVELAVLPDVAHQDAARAAQALGEVDVAAGHLRLAARTGPPKRRAFHLWTLGSLYFLAGRHADAISALSRAARWGTTDKPLYQGHLAVARCANGERVDDLADLIQKLAAVPAGQGYGRFVLGQMAFYDRRWDEARRYLEAFVDRSTGGRAALAIALDGEIALARETLAQLPKG